MENVTTIVMLVLLIAVMYFMMIRPQKKREREIAAMRDGVKVGDEVITIGGICGKIVKTKGEDLTIQVGADRTKFEIKRWAISKVVTEDASGGRKDALKKDSAKDSVEEEDADDKPKTLPKRLKPKQGDAAEEAPAAEDAGSEEAADAEAGSAADESGKAAGKQE
ncbi:MAG: preprotein translocase subunit YajC [Clostridiales Family XIII bacterium]|jgi:preprotein translocase subunit YajC|nr:preprotein translocase subunit YajC [Clostridiales Family XIII bacterium]